MPYIAMVFMGLVGLILAIACANVANMMLARATTRQREIAVRAALGASRFRILRQLLTESVALSAASAAVALALAYWATTALGSVSFSGDFPVRIDVSLDLRVSGFALALSLLTGVLAGLFPGLRVSRANLHDNLKEGGRSSAVDPAQHWMRSALVVSQVAISLVVLIAAGLFLRSVRNVQNIDLGFRSDNLLLMSMDATLGGYDEEFARPMFEELIESTRQMPGVETAAQRHLRSVRPHLHNETRVRAGTRVEGGRARVGGCDDRLGGARLLQHHRHSDPPGSAVRPRRLRRRSARCSGQPGVRR